MNSIVRKTRISNKTRREVYERDEYKCVYCGAWCGDGYPRNVAHIKSRGSLGKGTLDNLVTTCPSCHIKEHNGEVDKQIAIDYLNGLYGTMETN